MREVAWRIQAITKRRNIEAKFRAKLAGLEFQNELPETENVGGGDMPLPKLSDEAFKKIKERTLTKRHGRKEAPVNG
jgi:hypothetical protein